MATAFLFLALFLILPLAAVFIEAFRKGPGEFFSSLGDPDTRAAIRLTLLVAAISVPVNIVFGIAAAWSIAKFEFRGKNVLLTLIDLPFSVSPVIAGLIYVLVFGLQGNIDKVTAYVMLLVPPGVTAIDDESHLTGSFYNQS